MRARSPLRRWPKRSRNTRSKPTRSIRCTLDGIADTENKNMASVEVKVTDIGDFDEVSVIEVLVKPGDTVKAEQSLVTVESDKASMEIPSSSAGVVKEVRVKLGDKVKEGSSLVVLEGSDAVSSPPSSGEGWM